MTKMDGKRSSYTTCYVAITVNWYAQTTHGSPRMDGQNSRHVLVNSKSYSSLKSSFLFP